MINVADAKKRIIENCTANKIELLSLLDANGCILSEDVFSVIDTPPFNQSAVDGYAFSFDDLKKENIFSVKEEIQAGNFSTHALNSNGSVRIFTGAALPAGADTVIMQEKIALNGNTITLNDEQLVKGGNVRLKGAQTKKGEVACKAGQRLSPAGISFLAGIGIDNVRVYSKPVVSIIVTGNELVQPGSKISQGKIFESNSFALVAALHQLSVSPVSVDIVDDDESAIMKTINRHLNSDILILTGGVSVGDYDFVASALEKCGVKKIFHRVKQKPGKPFYFGKRNQTLVFGLPGNPAAVLTCFYEYIVTAISMFTKINYFTKMKMPIANDFTLKPGLTYFLKGKTHVNDVSVLSNQESYQMNSFALADCIIELEEEKEFVKKGDLVNVNMIV